MYKKFKIEEASNYQTVTSNLKYRIICKTKKEQKNPKTNQAKEPQKNETCKKEKNKQAKQNQKTKTKNLKC